MAGIYVYQNKTLETVATDLMSLFLISHRYCQDLFESPNVCTGLQELENYIIIVYFRLSLIGHNNTETALYKFT